MIEAVVHRGEAKDLPVGAFRSGLRRAMLLHDIGMMSLTPYRMWGTSRDPVSCRRLTPIVPRP